MQTITQRCIIFVSFLAIIVALVAAVKGPEHVTGQAMASPDVPVKTCAGLPYDVKFNVMADLSPEAIATIPQTQAFFEDVDLGGPAIAGIIGNGWAQSANDPTLNQGPLPIHSPAPLSPSRGFGYVMWTGQTSQQELVQFAASQELPASDLGVQLKFLWIQMTQTVWEDPAGCPHRILADLRAARTPAAAAQIFAVEYLRLDPQASLNLPMAAANTAYRYL